MQFKRFRKVSKEGAEVTSTGRAFQTQEPSTEKARRPLRALYRPDAHVFN